MRSVLISIKPEWTAKILNGEKTIEIRKTMPKCELPIDVYIYCTKGDYIGRISKKYVGKVVARFTMNEVEKIFMSVINHYQYETNTLYEDELLKQSLLNGNELDAYLKNKHYGYAWHISDLVIFDKPKELGEFMIYCDKHELCKCDNCKRLKQSFIDCGFDSEYCDNRLTKVPQSWCYVEEMEDAK